MKKCRIMVLTDDGFHNDTGFELAGTITLDDGKITGKPSPGDGNARCISYVLSEQNMTQGDWRKVTAVSDPEAWFNALPTAYHGTRMRAVMDKEKAQ
jgi:hypothetical protein